MTAAAEGAPTRRRHANDPAPSDGPRCRVNMSPLVAAGILGLDNFSGIIGSAAMTQDTAVARSDAQMWTMKLEGLRLLHKTTGRTTFRLQELMEGIALPETLSEIDFLIPQANLTLSGDQPDSPLVTAAQLSSFVQSIQQDSLVSMQPEKPLSWTGWVRLGTVGLGSQGVLSMFVLLDSQQNPWTFFIHTQQPDDRTAVTVKGVVSSLEDDLSGFIALPQLSPAAWANWHHGAADVPTVPVQATGAAAAEHSAKLPFDRVVYMYVSNSTLSSAEESTLCQADEAGHPWLERTVIHSSSIRNSYFSRKGVWSNDALRHAIFDKLLQR